MLHKSLSLPLCLAALSLSIGCDDSQVSEVRCGVGMRFDAAGDVYCVYDEDDLRGMSTFDCPAGVPFRIDIEGAVVCSPRDLARETLPEQVCGAVMRTCIPMRDAAAADLGMLDATTPDAAVPDAAEIDAREPLDASTPPMDAGDAEPPPDAGDAGPPADLGTDLGTGEDPCRPMPTRTDGIGLGPVIGGAAPDLAFGLLPRVGGSPMAVAAVRTGAAVVGDAAARSTGRIYRSALVGSGMPVSDPFASINLADEPFGATEILSLVLGMHGDPGIVEVAAAHLATTDTTSSDPIVATVGALNVESFAFGDIAHRFDPSAPEIRGRGVATRGGGDSQRFVWREIVEPGPSGRLVGLDETGWTTTTNTAAPLGSSPFLETVGAQNGMVLVTTSSGSILLWGPGSTTVDPIDAAAGRTDRIGVIGPVGRSTRVFYPSGATIRTIGIQCVEGCFVDPADPDALAYSGTEAISLLSVDEGAMAWLEDGEVRMRFLDDPREVESYTLRDSGLGGAVFDIQLSVAADGAFVHYAVAVLSAGTVFATSATDLVVFDVVRPATCL